MKGVKKVVDILRGHSQRKSIQVVGEFKRVLKHYKTAREWEHSLSQSVTEGRLYVLWRLALPTPCPLYPLLKEGHNEGGKLVPERREASNEREGEEEGHKVAFKSCSEVSTWFTFDNFVVFPHHPSTSEGIVLPRKRHLDGWIRIGGA